MTAAEPVVIPRGALRGHAYFVDFAGGSSRPPWWALALAAVAAIFAVIR